MIESPVLQEFVREREQAAAKKATEAAKAAAKEAARQNSISSILTVLVTRFGAEAKGLGPGLKGVRGERLLNRILKQAAICPDLNAFRASLEKNS